MTMTPGAAWMDTLDRHLDRTQGSGFSRVTRLLRRSRAGIKPCRREIRGERGENMAASSNYTDRTAEAVGCPLCFKSIEWKSERLQDGRIQVVKRCTNCTWNVMKVV